jgi:hypothetical protein
MGKIPGHKGAADFEVANEFVEIEGEQKPRWLSKEFTVSLHDKAALKQALDSGSGMSMRRSST